MKLPKRIGGPLPRALAAALKRELDAMTRQILATMPQVDSPAKAKALGAAVARAWSDAKIAAIVKRFGAKAETASSKGWSKLPAPVAKRDARARSPRRDAAEYDGAGLIDRWARAATETIASVRDEAIGRIHADVVDAYERGHDPTTLAMKWRREGIPLKFGTLAGRTQVIAQNQLAILHARVQSTRAASVGARSFVWHQVDRPTKRKSHEPLDGRTFDYDDPPDDGHLPGERPNCACWAETVIDDEVLAALGLDDVV